MPASPMATKPPAPQETEDSGPRLVIETSDGTLVDRSMGGVRRVTVEGGQVSFPAHESCFEALSGSSRVSGAEKIRMIESIGARMGSIAPLLLIACGLAMRSFD